MTDDLRTATALREALDEEVARHEFAADSWPVIARQLNSRPWWRTRAGQLAPAVAALTIAAVVAIVVIAGRPGTSPGTGGPGVHHHHSWLAKDGVLRFSGTKPFRLAAGYGAIWVGGAGVTYRVNPATDRIVDTISTQKVSWSSQFATGLGSVWVSGKNPNGTGLGIYRIDPRRDRATFIPLPGTGGATAFAVAYGSLWTISISRTATASYNSVLRIDPSTGQIVGHPILVTAGVPESIVAGFGRIWVNAKGLNAPVTVINPATGKVIKSSAWKKVTDVNAIGDGSLWAIGEDLVERVDPATGKITASVLLARPIQIMLVHGIAVVITGPEPGVAPPGDAHAWERRTAGCIDPATKKSVCRPVELAGFPAFYTTAPDGIWTTDQISKSLTHYQVTAPRS